MRIPRQDFIAACEAGIAATNGRLYTDEVAGVREFARTTKRALRGDFKCGDDVCPMTYVGVYDAIEGEGARDCRAWRVATLFYGAYDVATDVAARSYQFVGVGRRDLLEVID
jgi:hypothetical protein